MSAHRPATQPAHYSPAGGSDKPAYCQQQVHQWLHVRHVCSAEVGGGGIYAPRQPRPRHPRRPAASGQCAGATRPVPGVMETLSPEPQQAPRMACGGHLLFHDPHDHPHQRPMKREQPVLHLHAARTHSREDRTACTSLRPSPHPQMLRADTQPLPPGRHAVSWHVGQNAARGQVRRRLATQAPPARTEVPTEDTCSSSYCAIQRSDSLTYTRSTSGSASALAKEYNTPSCAAFLRVSAFAC